MAIILPAATFPLDIVQADRFLQKVKQDKNLKPDDRWDESIRNLVNYPEVISMMSEDLDWTQDLGEAVVSQQSDVLKAIQAFRAKAATAGNLKSDDKQLIVQENNVIQIVPADPEVIYVPQYQPSTVVVQQAAPVYGYYPAPYPSYYYPYPYGAGLAFGRGVRPWGGYGLCVQLGRRQCREQREHQQYHQHEHESEQPADSSEGPTRPGSRRIRPGRNGGGQASQSQGPRPGRRQQVAVPEEAGRGQSGSLLGQTAQARPGSSASGGASRGDAFGGGGRGSDAARDSSRGAESRGGGASASTMDRGGGGGSRGGASASTMDRGGSSSRGGSSGFSGGSSGGSRGGSSGGFSGGGGGSRGAGWWRLPGRWRWGGRGGGGGRR